MGGHAEENQLEVLKNFLENKRRRNKWRERKEGGGEGGLASILVRNEERNRAIRATLLTE